MHTHGDTYEEALQRGRELMALLLMESRRARGESPPERRVFATSA